MLFSVDSIFSVMQCHNHGKIADFHFCIYRVLYFLFSNCAKLTRLVLVWEGECWGQWSLVNRTMDSHGRAKCIPVATSNKWWVMMEMISQTLFSATATDKCLINWHGLWSAVIVALSCLLSQLSFESANSGKLSDDLTSLLAGLVPDTSSNTDTLCSTAAELLSSTCHLHAYCTVDYISTESVCSFQKWRMFFVCFEGG